MTILADFVAFEVVVTPSIILCVITNQQTFNNDTPQDPVQGQHLRAAQKAVWNQHLKVI